MEFWFLPLSSVTIILRCSQRQSTDDEDDDDYDDGNNPHERLLVFRSQHVNNFSAWGL